MDYIFKEWEEKLKAFEGSVEKDLEEVRKCKAEIQQMRVDLVNQMKKGLYVRDDQRLVLSAPEIIIGDVDQTGNLNSGSGSTVIVRGSQVGLQGVGGAIELRAARRRVPGGGVDNDRDALGFARHTLDEPFYLLQGQPDAGGGCHGDG